MLTVENVTKKFGNFTVLDDVSLEFENGVYGLIAPNGAGKTTLMKMLATLSFPTSGKICYCGDDILKLDEKYRDVIGYLPQQFGYYRDKTPKQYLKYLAALKGLDKKESDKRIDELLETVSLTDAANKKMRKFSGGMLQRVGIAQALLNDPKILMLDEPTAGLDPKERVRFRNIIASLSRDRIVLLSTHIVSDVESIANKIIMIKDHKILYNDTVKNICDLLDGKVFEMTLNESDITEFEKNYHILSQKIEHNTVTVRFISDNGEDEGAQKVYPGLEDVFLRIYGDDVI
ncbi:MAG: ABC transporter ATP-binding protein [Clostridia bacterium]|nr:ABC transporter ATP-binding protein [Clostridia bacterium]